jgi:hypothetical protein
MMIKKLSLFLWLILMQAPSWSANVDFKPIIDHPFTELPAYNFDAGLSYFKRDYAFSHDGRLFAYYQLGRAISSNSLPSGTYEGSTIQIFDTQTGALKYRTRLPLHRDAFFHQFAPILFSADNKMLVRANGNGADMFIWSFTQSQHIKILCSLGDPNETEHLREISQNQQLFFFSGVTYDVLCRQMGEMRSYKKIENRYENWEPTNAKVFHNNKLLFIYNIRSHLKPLPKPAFESTYGQDALRFVDRWNLNFVSKAEQLMQAIDQAQQRFILAEVFKDQVVIYQWNYANRQKIGSQVFKELQIKLLDDSKMNLYLSVYYLLIKANTKLTVFKRQDQQFSFVWSKDIPLLKRQPYLTMSKEGRYIVSANDDTFQDASESTLMDSITGKIISSYQNKDDPKRKYNSRTLIIEPVLTRFLNQRLDERMTDYDQPCSEQAKTKLYSLLTHQVVQEIEGEVVAMSADHKLLAVCQGRKLVLMRNMKSGS